MHCRVPTDRKNSSLRKQMQSGRSFAASSVNLTSALVRDMGRRGPGGSFAELAWVTDTNAPDTVITTTVARIMQVRGDAAVAAGWPRYFFAPTHTYICMHAQMGLML